MNKFLYLTIITLLCGCASTPQTIPFTYSFVEVSGSWEKREYVDELNGNWSRSYVAGPKHSFLSSVPFIFVNTFASGNWSVSIVNGDSYICDTGSLKVRVKFDNDEVYSLDRVRGEFALAKDNERILLRDNSWSSNFVESTFLEKLALSDNVIIETRDDCGEVRQIKFDIKGNPHFIAKSNLNL